MLLRIPDRIVSASRPFVRLIVRGQVMLVEINRRLKSKEEDSIRLRLDMTEWVGDNTYA